jgi:chromosome partition protein MukE
MDFQDELSDFYARYNVELIRAPEGFFYLRPRSTTLIPRSVLSEMDMLVGKILCYLYLSPERLANQGIFTVQELFDELRTLADEAKLLRLVNQRSTGSDLDLQKLQEKMRTSLNRLRRLGMISFLLNDMQRFSITEAQIRMIRDGEAMALENSSESPNEDEENEDEQLQSSEDDAEEENK